MSDIDSGNELFHQARAARDKLLLLGSNERLLAKIEDMLKLHHWHGGDQLKMQNLLRQVDAL